MVTIDRVVISATHGGWAGPVCLQQVRGRSILARLLDLVHDVADVRVVVDVATPQVAEHALAMRPDATIVPLPWPDAEPETAAFIVGADGLDAPVLYVGGNTVFEPDPFRAFLDSCRTAPLVAYTHARTARPLWVELGPAHIHRISSHEPSPWAWANLAYLPAGHFDRADGPMTDALAPDLPLPARFVDAFVIDGPDDLATAEASFLGFSHGIRGARIHA